MAPKDRRVHGFRQEPVSVRSAGKHGCQNHCRVGTVQDRGVGISGEIENMDMKILSIAAASAGWVAEFTQPDGSTSNMKVAVWAVVVDDDGHRVTGFSETDEGGFSTPDDVMANFAGWTLKPETK